MTKRKSLSKKTRFDVFKRDLFTCQYCGQKPPAITLEVDHIKPVKDGGCNDIDNLIAACFDCNRGKGAKSLGVSPDSLARKMEIQKEKAEQLKCYEKMLSSKKSAITRKVNKLNKKYIEINGGSLEFSDNFKESVSLFMQKLPYQEVEDSLLDAFRRTYLEGQILNYFCGICWNKIRGLN